MEDGWPMLRGYADQAAISPMVGEVQRALAILDAVTAPGTEVFGIRRFPIDGEDGCWMPADVAKCLWYEFPSPGQGWRHAIYAEVCTSVPETKYGTITSRLAARYEAATAPPPPKWERDIDTHTDGSGFIHAAHAKSIIRAALAEEQA